MSTLARSYFARSVSPSMSREWTVGVEESVGLVMLQVSSRWELWGVAQQTHLKRKLVSRGASVSQAEMRTQCGQASQEKQLV